MIKKTFLYHEKDAVAWITLNRPETLNALTFDVYAELRDTFVELNAREAVRAVVIRGAGRGFCSGGDVNEIIGELFKRDALGLMNFTRMTGDLIRNICELKKPVIASLNGIAAGAGAVIALASDFRVASDQAQIAFLFVKVGLAGADMGAAFLLPRVVGLSRANHLLYTGEAVRAADAKAMGLFHEVCPAEDLERVTGQWAARLAAGPTVAFGVTKAQLYSELCMSLPQALESEALAQALCMQTRDFREAYEAFREKRLPRFIGH